MIKSASDTLNSKVSGSKEKNTVEKKEPKPKAGIKSATEIFDTKVSTPVQKPQVSQPSVSKQDVLSAVDKAKGNLQNAVENISLKFGDSDSNVNKILGKLNRKEKLTSAEGNYFAKNYENYIRHAIESKDKNYDSSFDVRDLVRAKKTGADGEAIRKGILSDGDKYSEFDEKKQKAVVDYVNADRMAKRISDIVNRSEPKDNTVVDLVRAKKAWKNTGDIRRNLLTGEKNYKNVELVDDDYNFIASTPEIKNYFGENYYNALLLGTASTLTNKYRSLVSDDLINVGSKNTDKFVDYAKKSYDIANKLNLDNKKEYYKMYQYATDFKKAGEEYRKAQEEAYNAFDYYDNYADRRSKEVFGDQLYGVGAWVERGLLKMGLDGGGKNDAYEYYKEAEKKRADAYLKLISMTAKTESDIKETFNRTYVPISSALAVNDFSAKVDYVVQAFKGGFVDVSERSWETITQAANFLPELYASVFDPKNVDNYDYVKNPVSKEAAENREMTAVMANSVGDKNMYVAQVAGIVDQQIPTLLLAFLNPAAAAESEIGATTNLFTQTAQNPMFWSCFMEEFGPSVKTAKDMGVSDGAAYTFGLVTGALNSYIEIGSGLETLASNVAGTKTIKELGKEFLLSTLGEAGEEFLQYYVEEGGKFVLSPSVENNPLAMEKLSQALKNAGWGAIGGLLLGGVQTSFQATNIIQTNAQYKNIGEQYVKAKGDVGLLVDYCQNIENADVRTIAQNVTAETATDLDIGIMYNYAVKDISARLDVSNVNGMEKTEASNYITNEYRSIVDELGESDLVHSIATPLYVNSMKNIGANTSSILGVASIENAKFKFRDGVFNVDGSKGTRGLGIPANLETVENRFFENNDLDVARQSGVRNALDGQSTRSVELEDNMSRNAQIQNVEQETVPEATADETNTVAETNEVAETNNETESKNEALPFVQEPVKENNKFTDKQKNDIVKLGNKLNRKVSFADINVYDENGNVVLSPDGQVNEDGSITLNESAKNPYSFIIKHELTHLIENDKKAWDKFYNSLKTSKIFNRWNVQKDAEFRKIADSQTEEWRKEHGSTLKENYMKRYENAYGSENLSEKIDAEIACDFVGEQLFGAKDVLDAKKILNSIKNENDRKTFADYVRKLIDWLKSKFATDFDTVERLEKIWGEAFRQSNVGTEFEKRYKESGKEYSIPSELSLEYNELAKDPEKNKPRIMQILKEVALNKGYNIFGFHGTNAGGFTVFDANFSDDKLSIFAAENRRVAKSYTKDLIDNDVNIKDKKARKKQNQQGIYPLAIKMNNPLVIEGAGKNWNNISESVPKNFATVSIDAKKMRNGNFKFLAYYDTYALESDEDANLNIGEKTYTAEEEFDSIEELRNSIPDAFSEDFKDKIIEKVKASYDEKISNMSRKERKQDRVRKTLYDGSHYLNELGEEGKNTTREWAKYAYENGYDGVIVKDVHDMGSSKVDSEASDIYIVFNGTQLKSMDAVTYDGKGKVIPLSERFNENNKDIRYSIPQDFDSLLEDYDNGKISRQEFREKANEEYGKKLEQYGAIEPGENAGENPIRVPKSVDGKTKVRRHVRTIIESGVLTDDMIEDLGTSILKGDTSYEVISNKDVVESAESKLESGVLEKEWDKATAKETFSADAVAAGDVLLREAVENGDRKRAVEITCELSDMLTRAGQTIQAARIIGQLGGVGRLYHVTMELKKLQREIDKRPSSEKKNVKLEVNKLLAEQLAEAETEDEAEAIEDLIKQDLADQIPATLYEKLNAFRYLSMLGNPRTHIRNVVGNAIFTPAVQTKDIVAASLESVFVKPENRTKSVKIKKEYRNFAQKTLEEDKGITNALKGGKYNERNMLSDERRIFNNALLNFLSETNSKALEYEDVVFKNLHFKRAFAGFLQARKVDITKPIDKATKTAAIEYAVSEAQKATFNDYSALANALSNLGKKNKLLGFFVESLVPFKRTPVNIVKRGIEYSPIGLLKELSYGTKMLTLGKKTTVDGKTTRVKITASEYIDGIARGLTGSAVALVGYVLTSSGILRGPDKDDKDKYERDAVGKQQYSITIAGHSYTIDWAAPSSIPLLLGSKICELFHGEKPEWTEIPEVLFSALDPIIELTMLDGIQNALKSVATSLNDPKKAAGAFGNLLETVGVSYLSQYIPTLLGQVARTVDPYRRDSSKKYGNLVDKLSYAAQSKIPGLTKTLPAYIDPWGRQRKNSGWFENFFSPGYYSKPEYNKVDKELLRLNKATGEDYVFPSKPSKSFKVDGEKISLKPKEYEKYAKSAGQLSLQYINELIKNDRYDELDDKQKAEVISNLYGLSRAKAKGSVSDYDYTQISTLQGVYYYEDEHQDNEYAAVDYYIDKQLEDTGGKVSSSVKEKTKSEKSNIDSYGLSARETKGIKNKVEKYYTIEESDNRSESEETEYKRVQTATRSGASVTDYYVAKLALTKAEKENGDDNLKKKDKEKVIDGLSISYYAKKGLKDAILTPKKDLK